MIYNLSYHQQKMNNILGNYIGGRRFCPKDKGHRSDRFLTAFDFQILVDDIQCVHLLTFVFMQTFHLNIKNGIRIQRNPFRFPDKF